MILVACLLNNKNNVLQSNKNHNIKNRKDYFSMVKKGLKPNGEMIIVDFKKGDFEHGLPNEMKIHQ